MTALNLRSARKASHNGYCSFWECFYRIQFPSAVKYIPFSYYSMVFLFWVNAACTFNWNYLDFFIMAISLELSSRVSLINAKLLQRRTDEQQFWMNIRENYNRLACLTKKLDRMFSKIIITSYLNNFYHLSLQLLRSFKIKGSIYQKVYFYFSLVYLILKLLVVSFCAASVHDESKKPTDYVHSLEKFFTDTKRFLHQVATDDLALTGSRFFVISRSFVVTIITTIITYEVMLLQFNALHYADTYEE